MQIVSEIMGFLETAQWFSFENIVSNCSFPECKIVIVLNFLTQFGFLQMDMRKQIFRLHPDMIGLISRLDENKSQI